MGRNMFAVRIGRGTFSDGRSRLYVALASVKGGAPEVEWTPEWLGERGAATLLREAVRVERQNRPDSSYLGEFAELARDILIEHAPPTEVRTVEGSFYRYVADGSERPQIAVDVRSWTGSRYWEHGTESWPVGVPLPDKVLRELAKGNNHKWILWNGELIDVRDEHTGRSLL